MGTYLNPGKEEYEEAVRSEIFVDKSGMILYLNSLVKTKRKYVLVSRPRRFGKTMAAGMICAYYDRTAESRNLFENLKLAEEQTEDGLDVPFGGRSSDLGPGKVGLLHNSGLSGMCIKHVPVPKDQTAANDHFEAGKELGWDTYLGKFDVILLAMTRFINKKKSVAEALDKLHQLVIRDIKKAYPDLDYYSDDLIQTIEDVYTENGRKIVIVIDEWDGVFRERENDTEGQTEYLDFLRDLMKDNSHIALAYMTGILPIKKYGRHSALNMFTEYSMMYPRQLARYTGFTEEKVQILCNRYGRDYEGI